MLRNVMFISAVEMQEMDRTQQRALGAVSLTQWDAYTLGSIKEERKYRAVGFVIRLFSGLTWAIKL